MSEVILPRWSDPKTVNFSDEYFKILSFEISKEECTVPVNEDKKRFTNEGQEVHRIFKLSDDKIVKN